MKANEENLRSGRENEESRFDDWPIGDLRMVRSESGIDEDGKEYFMIFSQKLDALTPVGKEELSALKKRGLMEIERLPE